AQHATLRNTQQSVDDYFRRIEKKTALFFAACCQSGALATGASTEHGEALWRYGRNLGMAFQVVDDMLDVSAQEQVVGKPVGHDLESGVLTLPILYLLQDERYERRTERLIAKGESMTRSDVESVLTWARENGAIDDTFETAKGFSEAAKEALAVLPDSSARQILFSLADMVLTREY